MSGRYDWIVVGAGIIGSLTAWRLAQNGFRVALVDAGAPGQQATGAAAGILSPLAEAGTIGPFTTLMMHSLHRYPDLVLELTEESGIDIQYHSTGVLQIAKEDELVRLRQRYAWQESFGAVWVTDMQKLEPSLAEYHAAIYTPKEGQVHPPLLVQAAVRAALARNVHAFFGEPVRSLLRDGLQVRGVQLPTQDLWADAGVIITAGAWSHLIVDSVSAPLPLSPIRGQILSLKTDHAPFRHIIFHQHSYLVPKRDGRLIVGATEDDAGFDSRVTASGITRLAEILQFFRISEPTFYLEKVWAGLRPKSADGLPILGRWPGQDSLYIATGHYRNGVLLSAITADIALGWATNKPAPMDLSPFHPQRFHNTILPKG